MALIGNFPLNLDAFQNLEDVLSRFQTDDFKRLSARHRFRYINETLMTLILDYPTPCFLLAAVIDFIHKVNNLNVLDDSYHLTLFEFWLNHHAEISTEDNTLIRAKIAGQFIPREDYQIFFPIGMGKSFSGTHYVAAHLSPDVDTTIASFWGWLDAFAARVSRGLHLWSLPGGPPDSPIIALFKEIFTPAVFSAIARQTPSLTLNAMDLVTRKNVIKETAMTQISSLDHGYREKAVILVDEKGHYLGDWRHTDVEPVRQIIILFNACLRWFENTIHVELISIFAKEHVQAAEIPTLFSTLFDRKIKDCAPMKEFSELQQEHMETFLIEILHVSEGLNGTFGNLCNALAKLSLKGIVKFQETLLSLGQADIFGKDGALLEERPKIFHLIQQIIQLLDIATLEIRNYLERLDIAMLIKSKVLGKTLHYITLRNTVEDILLKIGPYDYLTVVIQEENHHLYPVGVVWTDELRKGTLGTVSFRDFCNPEEVKMASYLSVISVVDHHKTDLKTNAPPLALIGDAQSCNVIIAEQTIALNSRYSLDGMDGDDIAEQIDQMGVSENPIHTNLLQRLLAKKTALNTKGKHFVHPMREFTEYLLLLHAILDDTDLLSKVSNRDVNCVVELLNRLKTLCTGQESITLSLHSLPKDNTFAKAAAKKILQNEDMYSIYSKIYDLKEREVYSNIESLKVFADTKIQNGCCRVGQMKIFSTNLEQFQQHRHRLIEQWLRDSKAVYQNTNEIDLHLFMISTIPNAEEVYTNSAGNYLHKDELWIWIPSSNITAQDHLAIFLSGFRNAPEISNNLLSLDCVGSDADVYARIFEHNFIALPHHSEKNAQNTLAILGYTAGSINSRKSMISPYLPRA